VTDDTGLMIGAVSARDLLRLQGQEAIELTDEIEAAVDTADLARAWGRLLPAVTRLRRDGLSALELAALISQHVVELTRGAARIAERESADAGSGSSASPFALAVLGSAARGESLLAMDQDNALIGSPDSLDWNEAWFGRFTEKVNAILHTAGVPYCAGGVMAKNPSWRGSEDVWRRRISDWMTRTSPKDLLAVDIFFDLKTAYGDPALGERLRLQALDLARGNAAFAKLMLEAAGRPEAALKWSGGFRTENGRIDLKKAGLFSLVSTTRVLAIWHHVSERSTRGRLSALRSLLPHAAEDIDALFDAHAVFLEFILDQQLADAAQGIPVSNRVEVKNLSAHDRGRLRTALSAISHLDQFAKDELFS
jgi:DNA polymerase-3 subunit epsilon/CBS domain-containing protein